MALKDRTRARMKAGLATVVERGEKVQAAALASRGPNPLLWGFLGGMMTRYFFLAVTDRQVVAVPIRGGQPLFAQPRDSVSISEATSHPIFNRVMVRLEDGTDVLFRIHRTWREEFEAFVEALGGTASAGKLQPG